MSHFSTIRIYVNTAEEKQRCQTAEKNLFTPKYLVIKFAHYTPALFLVLFKNANTLMSFKQVTGEDLIFIHCSKMFVCVKSHNVVVEIHTCKKLQKCNPGTTVKK